MTPNRDTHDKILSKASRFWQNFQKQSISHC